MAEEINAIRYFVALNRQGSRRLLLGPFNQEDRAGLCVKAVQTLALDVHPDWSNADFSVVAEQRARAYDFHPPDSEFNPYFPYSIIDGDRSTTESIEYWLSDQGGPVGRWTALTEDRGGVVGRGTFARRGNESTEQAVRRAVAAQDPVAAAEAADWTDLNVAAPERIPNGIRRVRAFDLDVGMTVQFENPNGTVRQERVAYFNRIKHPAIAFVHFGESPRSEDLNRPEEHEWFVVLDDPPLRDFQRPTPDLGQPAPNELLVAARPTTRREPVESANQMSLGF